jgi:dihydrolipoamide dehydrogenase
MMPRYNLAVIGSGSGGREAALLGARKGLRTALIERDKLGGTTFHRGCYAVLALQACARQFRDTWKSGRFGNKPDLLKATLDNWLLTQRKVTSRLVDNFQVQLQRSNVEFLQGHGSLLDERTLQVIDAQGHKTTFSADHVIVATGSRPDFNYDSNPRLVNTDQLLSINVLPQRLIIVGAGYIGCEFASIYRTLGAEVTLIEKANRILPGWEAEIGRCVAEALDLRGVRLVLDHEVALNEVRGDETGLRLRGPGGQAWEAEAVLVATGRKPNSGGLGLRALGIDDASTLSVDAGMRLPTPGLYAVGDVTGLSLLDSTAFSQANVAIHAILGHEGRYEPRGTPRCIHTEPAVATVGWTEAEAAGHGVEFTSASTSVRLVSDLERSLVDPEPTFIKVIVNSRSRHLLGCLVVGDHAAVIANVAAIAIRLKVPIEEFCEIPMAQPSATDALMSTLRQVG